MKYENRIIAYIDILGFKNLIKETEEKKKDLKDISLILETVMEPFKSPIDERDITQFSDLIVISFNIDKAGEILKTLIDIQTFVTTLIHNGILVRGGITYGKIHHNDEQIFGPGLINAYETELNAALYPRIILDSTIIEYGKFIHNKENSWEKEDIKIKNIVTEDTDGMYYVDYFYKYIKSYSLKEENIFLYINQLRKIIIELEPFSKNPSIKVKRGWLKDKYNNLILNLKSADFLSQSFKEDLLIMNKKIQEIDFLKS